MSGPGKFPRVVQLSRRLHAWWCPSVNSFKLQPCDHTPPGTRRLRFPAGRRGGRRARLPPIPGRHRLRLRLRRYLIVFDPLTFVLDRGGRPRQKPSPSSIFRQSENFTSDDEISMAPTVPVDRAPRPRDRRFGGSARDGYPVLRRSRRRR